MSQSAGIILLGCFVVTSGVLNTILGRIRAKPLGNLDIFVTLLNSVVQMVMYFSILLVRYSMGKVTKLNFRYIFEMRKKGNIFQRLGAFKYMIIAGVADISGNALSFISQSKLSGPIFVILGQTTLPFSILVGYTYLKRKYTLHQLCACVVALMGVFFMLVPPMLDSKKTSNNDPLYLMIFVLSNLPTAISFAIKEKIFDNYKLYHLDMIEQEGDTLSPEETGLPPIDKEEKEINAAVIQSKIKVDSLSTPLIDELEQKGLKPPAQIPPRFQHTPYALNPHTRSVVSSLRESFMKSANPGGKPDMGPVDEAESVAQAHDLYKRSVMSSGFETGANQEETEEDTRAVIQSVTKKASLDVFCVNSFSTLFSIPFVPFIMYLKLTADKSNIGVDTYITDGFQCLGGNTPSWYNSEKCAAYSCCEYALISYIAYILANCSFNISLMAFLKKGSAVFSFIVMKMIGPIAILLYVFDIWPLLSDADREVTIWAVPSLIVATLGVVYFRFASQWKDTVKSTIFDGNEPSCFFPFFKKQRLASIERQKVLEEAKAAAAFNTSMNVPVQDEMKAQHPGTALNK